MRRESRWEGIAIVSTGKNKLAGAGIVMKGVTSRKGGVRADNRTGGEIHMEDVDAAEDVDAHTEAPAPAPAAGVLAFGNTAGGNIIVAAGDVHINSSAPMAPATAAPFAAPSRGTHFLDSLPFDLSHPGAQELLQILADVYWNEARAVAILRKAKIPPASANLSQSMTTAWSGILVTARGQNKLRALVDAVVTDPDAASWASRLEELRGVAPAVETKAPVVWKGDQPGDPATRAILERQIEERPTLLRVSFLAEGMRVAPAVARILVTYASGDGAVGTGLRIGKDLLLTNHHVLFDRAGQPATAVELWFNYEVDLDGRETPRDVYFGDPSSILGDKGYDWAVVTPAKALSDVYPILPLTPKQTVAVDDRVCIIQHPAGGPKQIGLYHNDVRFVDDRVVQYRTDTLGGSSGSPVLNERWEVVALHHASTPARASSSGSKETFWNEGIRIERVVEGLRAKGVI